MIALGGGNQKVMGVTKYRSSDGIGGSTNVATRASPTMWGGGSAATLTAMGPEKDSPMMTVGSWSPARWLRTKGSSSS